MQGGRVGGPGNAAAAGRCICAQQAADTPASDFEEDRRDKIEKSFLEWGHPSTLRSPGVVERLGDGELPRFRVLELQQLPGAARRAGPGRGCRRRRRARRG